MATLNERRRAKAQRQAQDAQARYDGAGFGRRIKAWNPPNSGPRTALAEGFERLRSRALDAQRNDWAATSGIQKWKTNLVGVGIQPRWENERYREIWDMLVPQADADGVLDAYGLQTLLTGSWLASGEVFLRRRPRPLTAPLEVPVQFQVIESHFVPMLDADAYPGMPAEHTIRQGIERNKYGRRTAIWMYRDHPGDGVSTSTVAAELLVRVPISEVRHMYEPTRGGQLRGVTTLHSILVRLRAAMNFEDATLDRQLLANLFVATLRRDMPPNWADIETDPATGLPKWYDAKGRALMGLEPGVMQELAPGEHLDFNAPPAAASSYPDYMRSTHLGTAAGQGLPYELMSGDIKDVADRTLRIVIQEFRRFCEQRQFQILIPLMCQPMVDWAAEAALLKGLIAPSEVKAFKKCEWSPHGWDYIHPVQDVDAAIKARDGGLTSTSRLIAKRGDDPRVILKERQADEASGLTPKPPEPAAPAGNAPPKDDPEALARTAWFQAQASLVRRQTESGPPESALATAVKDAMQRLGDIMAAQHALPRSEVIATDPMAPQLMDKVTELVQAVVAANQRADMAAVQSAQAQIETLSAAVASLTERIAQSDRSADALEHFVAGLQRVETAVSAVAEATTRPITVTNEVHVEPAPVEVKLHMPTRQSTTSIERDQTGDIVKTTTTETTVDEPEKD